MTTKYLPAMLRSYGYQMLSGVAPKAQSTRNGFVPAEEYIRQRGLTIPLQLASIHHCLDCPEWRRQHALTETMIALLTLIKNRPKPPLKQRQTMDAVTC